MLSRFSIIVAVDSAGGISKGGSMPWPNSSASTFFRDMTIGNRKNAVIMGRRTYDAIPPHHRPLEGRQVYVVSRTWRQEDHQEVTVCESVLDALTITGNKVNSYEEIFVAGGEMLFASIMANYMYLCNRVYITRYKMNFQCDQLFDIESVKEFPLFQPTQLTHDFQRFYYKCPIVHPEYEYLSLLNRISVEGENKKHCDTPIKEIFSASIRFSVTDRLPVITTRQIEIGDIVGELLRWMNGTSVHPGCEDLGGSSCSNSPPPSYKPLSSLSEQDDEYHPPEVHPASSIPRERVDVPEWCDLPHIAKRELIERFERGDYGPYEGFLLRHWNADYDDGHADYTGKGLDQLEYIITNLRTSPSSHKHIVSLWNLGYYADQLLHPETVTLQFSLSGDGQYLDLLVSKRECDVFSQLPEDVTKMALFLAMVCHIVRLRPRDVIFNIGHAYVRDLDVPIIQRQCKRTPRPFPTYSFRRAARIKELSDFTPESVLIELYTSWPSLRPRE